MAALNPSAHAAQPVHDISAATVIVVQNDAFNTTASVTLSTGLRINGFKIRPGSNRGDYNIQIGDDAANDVVNGVLMTCVTENGRDNGAGETAYPGINYLTSAMDGDSLGEYWIPVFNAAGAAQAGGVEYNVNVAGAYFPYAHWLGGWARNSTNNNGGANDLLTASPGIVLGTHFVDLGGGKSTVDLRAFGYSSTNDGVLLVTGGKNEDNYALSSVNTTNGTWTVYVHDNGANGASYEQDYVAFVFIPRTNTTVISGRIMGDATTSLESTPFAVTKGATGVYHLTIPGHSPADGILMISAEGGSSVNADNIVSYQATADGWDIMSRDLSATSSSAQYPPTGEGVVSFVFIPGPTPGFAVTPTNGLTTTESGGTATFSVALDTAPTADVTVNVSSSNASEGSVAPASLTFTPLDWDVPQLVTATGVDDALIDGPVGYRVILAPASSADTNYNGLAPVNVAVVNNDNDQAGATILPSSGLVTTEDLGFANFSVALNAPPSADVTVGLSSSNPNEGVIYQSALTFTPSDWNVPQTVTVYGVDDADDDGDVTYSIITAPAVSADTNYNGLNLPDVALVNRNNDTAAVLFAPTNNLVVLEGGTTTYTVALITRPTATVIVQSISSNPTKGTIAPPQLTFTPDNWNVPQTITLQGMDNLIADGSFSYYITNTVSSADTNYAALAPGVLNALTLDNEPALKLPSGPAVYGLGMPAVGLDGRAALAELDTAAYPGGSLTAALIANGTADDRLEIRSAGTNDNQINLAGGDVNFGPNLIGSFSGGVGTSALVISLNSNATPAAVQELLRSITFRTGGSNPSEARRSVQIAFNDGLGATVGASKDIRVGLLRLTEYQEGADHGYGAYSGAADIALSQAAPSTPWPLGRNASEGLLIDWPDAGVANASQVLLRFDNLIGDSLGQLPTNAVIVSAELLVNVNNTGDGGTMHRMLVPWDATNDTWNSLGGGVLQDDLQSRSEYESQMGLADGSGATGEGIVAVGVTPDVQAWLGGQTNWGWVIAGWTNNTDGTGLSPSEAADLNLRPRLRVYWLPAGTAMASFRQGVDGYTSAFDTRLRQAEPDNNTNAATVTSLYVDGGVTGSTDPEQILIRFDNLIGLGASQVPPGAHVHAAFLDLASVIGNAMGDGGQFFALLQPWSDTNSTWNIWTNGIQTDDLEAAATPTAQAGVPELAPNVQGAFLSFDLTPDVQSWANGTRPNYGWAILPWAGGTDGWGFGSSESSGERNRPRLRVYYTSDRAIITAFGRSGAGAELRFRGTEGKTYSIERSPTLNGPWTSIGTEVAGPGGNVTATDGTPLPDSGFYRIVLP